MASGNVSSPGQEAGAAHLVRVSLLHHVVRAVRCSARVPWCGPAREAGRRKIEAAPEEVDGARLADEFAAELLEDVSSVHQHAPERVGPLRIIGPVLEI